MKKLNVFLRMKSRSSVFVLLLVLTGCAGASVPKRVIVFPPPPDTPRFEWIGTFESENDFEKVGMERVVRDISGGTGSSGFKGPLGIAAKGDGSVVVADAYAQEVKLLDLANQNISRFSDQHFRTPLGLATDQQGRIYVADGPARHVVVLAADGTLLSAIGDKERFEKPAFLAINHTLERLYVSDSKSHEIKVFSLDGEFLFSFGGVGGDQGRFNVPQGLAIDAEGQVFVADMLNARIQVFSADGEFLRDFGSRGTLKSQFETPKGLAFDSEGHLYVVDSRRPNFRVFNPDGTLLLELGGTQRSSHKLGFILPAAICVDRFDRVFIADMLAKRVTVWQYLSAAHQQRQQAKP